MIWLFLCRYKPFWTLSQQCFLATKVYVYLQSFFLKASGGYQILYIYEYLSKNNFTQSFLLNIQNQNIETIYFNLFSRILK